MAPFPVTARFVGDFVPHLVAVDTDDTWDEFAAKVAVHSVGRRIAEPDPNPGYEVLLDGNVLCGGTLGDLLETRQLPPLQWFDVRFRQDASSNV